MRLKISMGILAALVLHANPPGPGHASALYVENVNSQSSNNNKSNLQMEEELIENEDSSLTPRHHKMDSILSGRNYHRERRENLSPNFQALGTSFPPALLSPQTNEYTGHALAMNYDGHTIVIGAYGANSNQGRVRVYKYTASEWVLNETFEGDSSGSNFGFSVGVDKAGNTVTAGSPGNTKVSVHTYSSSAWTTVWIDGTSGGLSYASGHEFGYSLAINGDGDKIVVGVKTFTNSIEAVVPFHLSGGSWQTYGSAISGDNAGDMFGYSIAMSDNSLPVLVVGAPKHSSDLNVGQVKVYSDNGSGFAIKGSAIVGETTYEEFGTSVAIDEDGDRIIVGAPGYSSSTGQVRIYSYDSDWTQLGTDLDGLAAGDKFGYTVAMDRSGTNIFVGAPLTGTATGYVKEYEYESDAWKYIDIINIADINLGESLACSWDGELVFTGSGSYSTNTGYAQVFYSYAESSNPSSVPSTSLNPSLSTVPSLSAMPSDSPSRNPSAQPSNVPSSNPSSLPSIQPTMVPSITPTDSPSAVPSTSHPTKLPSYRPSRTPSHQPSMRPTLSPSDAPSRIPSVRPTLSMTPTHPPSMIPSVAPTLSIKPTLSQVPSDRPTFSMVPSMNPTILPSTTLQPSETPTSSPSIAPYCFNENDFLLNGDESKDCSWVGESPFDRCQIKINDPIESGKFTWVHQHCREACNKCACVDKPDWVGDKTWKTCRYVAKKPKKRCINVDGAKENCRLSCGNSDTCCRNDPDYYFRKKSRNCKKIASFSKATEKRCKRPGIAYHCPIVCGVCNYSDYRNGSRIEELLASGNTWVFYSGGNNQGRKRAADDDSEEEEDDIVPDDDIPDDNEFRDHHSTFGTYRHNIFLSKRGRQHKKGIYQDE